VAGVVVGASVLLVVVVTVVGAVATASVVEVVETVVSRLVSGASSLV